MIRKELFLVQDFKPGDIVVITVDYAGMKSGQVGMVTDINYDYGILEIRLSENLRYYNVMPDWINHTKI